MDRENKVYQNVLVHRKNCKKWMKGFCLDCFGGGLNRFVDDFGEESRKELGLPSVGDMIMQQMALEKMKSGVNNLIKPSRRKGKC